MISAQDADFRGEMGRFTPALRAFARALRDDHDADEADELVQATLVSVLADRRERRGLGLRLWLLSTLIGAHRRTRQRQTASLHETARNRTASQGGAGAGWEAPRPARSKASGLLDDLPLECRETLLLVALEGLTYAQTAECLGVSLNVVIGNLARARDRLGQGERPAAAARAGVPTRSAPYLRVVK